MHLKERTCLFTFKCGSDTSKLCTFRQSTSVLSGYRRWNTYMLTVCRHYVKCLHTQGPSCGPSGVAPHLVIISGLPSSPVLFPPHFLNYVKLPQKCKPLQLNLTITSLVLLKITHLVLCGVLLEWTRRKLYFCLLVCFIPSIFCFSHCPAHLHIYGHFLLSPYFPPIVRLWREGGIGSGTSSKIVLTL